MGAARPAIRALLADQRGRWRAGDRVHVEQLVAAHPTLADHPDALLDLIYAEVLLRRAAGEQPNAAEYAARFPALAAEVRDQFEVDAALPERPTELPRSTGPCVPAAGPTVPPGYELIEEVGRGGMGVVYEARHLKLDRIVALKMVRSGEFADPLERARFASEARAVARLSHPNIVQIYEVGEASGCPFLALEFVRGGTLGDVLTGPLPPRPSAALVATVARAVHHAHDAGIVHRDLKPGNVLLGDDDLGRMRDAGTTLADPPSSAALPSSSFRPKVTDFGLAKLLEVADGPTRTGDFLGTPNYAAPEQAFAAEVVGPPADVHALGAILYHLLTGRPPFVGASAIETLDQVRFADPVPPSRLRPNLPRDLETIALTCLRKEQAKRYPSAAALADDLDRFLAGRPIAARPVGIVERGAKWCRRRPAVAGLIASLVALTAAALGTVTVMWQREAAARGVAQAERQRAANRSAELLVANARLAWMSGDFPAARAALDECPVGFRGPDWAYLDRVTAPPVLDVDAGDTITRLAFNPDGTLLAGVSRVGRIRAWEAATGREPVVFRQRAVHCEDVTFTPDGRLAVASVTTFPPGTDPPGTAEVQFLDPKTGDRLSGWRHPDHALRFTLAPGAKYAAFGAHQSDTILILDGATGARLHALRNHSRSGNAVTFSTTGRWFATQGVNEDVRVFDPGTGLEVGRLPAPGDHRLLMPNGLHPDGQRVALNNPGRGNQTFVSVRDLAAPGAGLELPVEFWVLTAVAYSPDGRWIATCGTTERAVIIWDGRTGAEVLPLRGHPAKVSAFAFGPTGRQLAVACNGGRVLVWAVRPPGDD